MTDVVPVRHRFVRREPREVEVDRLAGPHHEVRVMRGVVVGLREHAAAQDQRVGTGHGQQTRQPLVVDDPAHPGHRLPVGETDRPPHGHVDLAGDALDPAYEVGMAVPDGHRVDQADDAGVGLPLGFEHQGALPVAPAGPAYDAVSEATRAQLPAAVALVAEQRGETGGRVETRQAEPVDRAVPGDERHRVGVADDGVILDEQPRFVGSHGCILPCPRRHRACCTSVATTRGRR